MDNKEYITDRIKKLTNALYRVTDLLSDREPLKWTLRDKAIDIYNNLINNNKNIDFSAIINILDLFSPESSISNINYDILKKEYIKLKNITPEQKIIIEPMDNVSPIGQTSPIRHKVEKESSRKDKILEFLNQGPKTISEIAPLFEQISEKSIQRDLIGLKNMGKISTEGEKRWRKYKLLTNIQV